MKKLPRSLSIAIWFVGAMWFVGIIGYLTNASPELVAGVFVLGLITAVAEWRSVK